MTAISAPILTNKPFFSLPKPAWLLGLALLAGLAFPETGAAQRPDRTRATETNRTDTRESSQPRREVPRAATPSRERANRESYSRPARTRTYPRQPASRSTYSRQPDGPGSRELAYGTYNNRRNSRYRSPAGYNPSYRDRSPNWHYRHLPRRGYSVPFAPTSSITVAFGGVYFHYDNGVYYRPLNGRYVVVPAPIGLRTRVIPPGHLRLFLNQRPYYYYYGTYYELQNGYYEVVKPPVGALVESIPDGYEQLVIDGETYYLVDGVQYKPVLHHNEIWYEVLKVD